MLTFEEDDAITAATLPDQHAQIQPLDELQRISSQALIRAIEAGAGMVIPDLCASLEQARGGEFSAASKPVDVAARKRGRPLGSVKVNPKVPTTIRFDADVLEALKATGTGWQTRANVLLRDAIAAGRLAKLSARAVV